MAIIIGRKFSGKRHDDDDNDEMIIADTYSELYYYKQGKSYNIAVSFPVQLKNHSRELLWCHVMLTEYSVSTYLCSEF